MSATVKLSSRLPGDEEINGLDSIVEDLISSNEPVVAIAWLVPAKTIVDRDTGEKVPTVEVRRIEPIGNPGNVPTAITTIAAELYEQRTGRNPLPIDQILAPKGDVDELNDDEPQGLKVLNEDDFEDFGGNE